MTKRLYRVIAAMLLAVLLAAVPLAGDTRMPAVSPERACRHSGSKSQTRNLPNPD